MNRIIVHLDFDSFFATVEQQANSCLRGKPVGITKQEGRACVIAASVEAKKFGVKTGTTIWEAKKLCPRIILVPADFEKYFSVTKQMIKICARFTPFLEVFSIDEVFLDLTESESFFGGPFFTVLKIKQLINQKIGAWITCSAGVSHNKLLAKLASSQDKPDGYFEINLKNRDEVLGKVKINDICGIGGRLTPRLLNAGITNLLQIRQVPDNLLKSTFGPFWAKELKRLSWGEDQSPVVPSAQLPEMKSVSRTFTLFKNTYDQKKIRQTMRNLCEEAARKIRDMKLKTRQVGLQIRGDDQTARGYQALKHHFDDGQEIFKIAFKIYQNWDWTFSVRFVGIWLGLLEKSQYLSEDLFPRQQKRSQALKAADQINRKFGDFTLYPAALLGNELIRPEVNGYLGDKKYRL